jgi:hypothetical protein
VSYWRRCVILVLSVLAAAVVPVAAESVRLGVMGGVELWNRPTYAEVRAEFDKQANVFPGFYWEVVPRNFGFGMTALVNFPREDPYVEGGDYIWYSDWIASWDFRYHFFRRFLLDPFVELGVGSGGRVQMTGAYEGDEDLNLSLFAQVGGGLAIRLRGVHLGARVLYRAVNSAIPAVNFDVYPLKTFHVDVFAGVSL